MVGFAELKENFSPTIYIDHLFATTFSNFSKLKFYSGRNLSFEHASLLLAAWLVG